MIVDFFRELRIEWVVLFLNISICVRYAWEWKEPGKVLYWLGASILVLGLLRMKG